MVIESKMFRNWKIWHKMVCCQCVDNQKSTFPCSTHHYVHFINPNWMVEMDVVCVCVCLWQQLPCNNALGKCAHTLVGKWMLSFANISISLFLVVKFFGSLEKWSKKKCGEKSSSYYAAMQVGQMNELLKFEQFCGKWSKWKKQPYIYIIICCSALFASDLIAVDYLMLFATVLPLRDSSVLILKFNDTTVRTETRNFWTI